MPCYTFRPRKSSQDRLALFPGTDLPQLRSHIQYIWLQQHSWEGKDTEPGAPSIIRNLFWSMETCHVEIPICLQRNSEQFHCFTYPSIKVSALSHINSLVSPNPSYTISWSWQLERFLSVHKSRTSTQIMDFNGAITLQWQLLQKAKNKVTMLAHFTIGSYFLGIAIKMWAKGKWDCNAH